MDTRKHWLWTFMGVAALTLGGAGLTGCDGDAEDAGEDVGRQLDKAGDKIKDAADDVGDEIEDVGDKIEDKLD